MAYKRKQRMDMNKSRLVFILSFMLATHLNVAGQAPGISGKVMSQNKQPVAFAHLVLFGQDSVFIKGTTADSIGNFSLTRLPAGSYTLSVSAVGFNTGNILIQNLTESVIVEVLLHARDIALDEVVVSAPSVINRIHQRIVFPVNWQREHSSNGIQLLNAMMLPGLRVNPLLHSVSSSDGGDVVLQINGVNVASEEILALRPGQIKRVEYADYAGIRYSHSSRIVNFIVHGEEKGGVIGVDLMNSLNIRAGGDVMFMKYNRGKSEYALHYTVSFQDFKGNKRDRVESFHFADSTSMKREERGDKGKYVSQIHDLLFSYNYQMNDSSFFNGKLKLNVTNQPHNDFHSILTGNDAVERGTSDRIGQTMVTPSVDLYYQYRFKNRQKVYANLVGSHVKTALRRHYREYSGPDTTYRQQMQLYSKKYSIIVEGIYEKGLDNGSIKFGLWHSQFYAKQEYLQTFLSGSRLRQSESSVFSEWYYNKNNLSFSLGARWNLSGLSNHYYSHVLPKIMLGYRVSENAFLRYDAEVKQSNPSLIQLVDTEIRIDSLTSEKGNPELEPYWNLMNTVYYEGRMGRFTFTMHLRQHHKQHPIMESKSEIERRFMAIPRNMKSWDKYNAEMTGKVGVFKNIIQLSLTSGINHFNSRGESYSHRYSNLYYRADVLAFHKHWMFIGQMQSADERLSGETLVKDNNYHYLAIQYNKDNFSLGIGAFNPFKNESRTIMENRNEHASYRRVSYSEASQTLVITFTWNLHFGKALKTGDKSLHNQDIDYGVREIYK
jgi:hypothetical protein